MDKRSYSIAFTLVASLLNIVFTGLIIFALLCATTLVLSRVLHVQEGGAYLLDWIACFIGGMVLGMVAFSKLCGAVIARFNLAEKFDPTLMGKFLPASARGKAPAPRPEKPKTNLPASALPPDDADEWD